MKLFSLVFVPLFGITVVLANSQNSQNEEDCSEEGKTCQEGWMTFNRPQGTWCVKVFPNVSNIWGAEEVCKAEGATLTGVQSTEERIMIADAGRELNLKLGNVTLEGSRLSVWLGARRRAECPNKGDCSALNQFLWTDKNTNGTDGFVWSETNPSGPASQKCAQLLIAMDQKRLARDWCRKISCPHGSLDDTYCENKQMVACGKEAI
ncbi:unnamed protein product [Caenorhabditis nigoni]